MLRTDAIVNATDLPEGAVVDVRVTGRLNPETATLEVTHVVADIMTEDGRAIGRAERSAAPSGIVWSMLLSRFEWTYVNPAFSVEEAAGSAERKEVRGDE
jgi:hypothetical protein